MPDEIRRVFVARWARIGVEPLPRDATAGEIITEIPVDNGIPGLVDLQLPKLTDGTSPVASRGGRRWRSPRQARVERLDLELHSGRRAGLAPTGPLAVSLRTRLATRLVTLAARNGRDDSSSSWRAS